MNERLLQGDLFWVYCGFLMNCKGDRDTYSHMAGSSVELVLSLFCLDTSWKAPHCPWNKNKKNSWFELSLLKFTKRFCFCATLRELCDHALKTEVEPYWESGLHQVAMPIRKKGELLLHVYPSIFRVQLCDTCNSWDSVDTTSKCILSTLHLSVVCRDWPWDQNHLPGMRSLDSDWTRCF